MANRADQAEYLGPNRTPGNPPSTHVRDVRLSLIDSLGFSFQAKRCLDIGCNDGTVGTQLAFDFGARQVIGVDIDANLVTKAEHLLALRASRARPAAGPGCLLVDYFPMSAVLRYGHTSPFPPSPSSSPRVRFVAADWAVSADPAVSGPYDVILALSVIKWIHLEHLDDGIASFFRKCSAALASGGILVVELQTWDSYTKAVRPNAAPHFARNLEQLKYRPETDFEPLLRNEGFDLCATSDRLRRRINVYRRT